MAALAKNNFMDTIQHWKHIAPVIHEPRNSDDYDKLSSFLDRAGNQILPQALLLKRC